MRRKQIAAPQPLPVTTCEVANASDTPMARVIAETTAILEAGEERKRRIAAETTAALAALTKAALAAEAESGDGT